MFTNRRFMSFLVVTMLSSAALAGAPHPFGSQVPIHGRLAPLGEGVPTPNGTFEISYEVCDAFEGGNTLGGLTSPSVDVINGIFFDAPDFGAELFGGEGQRFIKISIRPAGSDEDFIEFQKIEIKPHPRAQFAGEIFLPATKTVNTDSLTSGFSLINTGTGSAFVASIQNTANRQPAILADTNGTGPAITALSTGTGPAFNGIGSVILNGTDGDDTFDVNLPANFFNEVQFNSGAVVDDFFEIISNQPIVNQGASAVISNTNSAGRALLAFNQNGGEGVFGSSINGIGVVCDGSGSPSIGCLALSNTGRPAVIQTGSASSSNPSLQVVNPGLGNCVFVQQTNVNAALSGVAAVNIQAASGVTGTSLTCSGESRLVGDCALGGNFNPTEPLHHVSGANLSDAGLFINASSRALKENFAPVDCRQVLELLTNVPISTWNYRVDDDAVRHLGPTAEDFAAAFHVGANDRTIGTVDADGVALAAIQALHQMVQDRDARIDELSRRLARLEATLGDRE